MSNPESEDARQTELSRLNRVWPGLGLGLTLFGSIYALAIPVGFVSLVVARLSAGSGPLDTCGFSVVTWNWSLLPFGFECVYGSNSSEKPWDGPPVVFHEVNTPAMVTFLVATAIVVVTVAVHAMRTRDEIRIEPGQFA